MNRRLDPLFPLVVAALLTLSLNSGPGYDARSAGFAFDRRGVTITIRDGQLIDQHRTDVGLWRRGDAVEVPFIIAGRHRHVRARGTPEAIAAIAAELGLEPGSSSTTTSGWIGYDYARNEFTVSGATLAGLRSLTIESYLCGFGRASLWVAPREEVTPSELDSLRVRLLHWTTTLITLLVLTNAILHKRWLDLVPIAPAAAIVILPLITRYAVTLPSRTFALSELGLLTLTWLVSARSNPEQSES